jgi:hypothetical protein
MAQIRHTGFVYAVSNEGFPGLLKVGRTGGDVRRRVAALSRMVPVPFVLEYSIGTYHPGSVESLAHSILQEYRVNPRREWFRVSVELAQAAIDEALLMTEDGRAAAKVQRDELRKALLLIHK